MYGAVIWGHAYYCFDLLYFLYSCIMGEGGRVKCLGYCAPLGSPAEFEPWTEPSPGALIKIIG